MALSFENAYTTLTKPQKEAVDTVEGPVLVIAGPGTGKTHILTLRIANILKKTDAKPDSILVLTFTDSAARNVAKRLGGLIGEETARKVGVYTFHRFAEEIMRRHPDAFAAYADSRLMGEMEQILLWREVLETSAVTRLRSAKAPYHYLKDLKSLEDEMLRERLSVEDYRAWLDEREKEIEADPKLRYVRGGKGGAAGELNAAGKTRLERIEKGREAANLIEAYRALSETRGLYGYTDVLRIAVDALMTDEALRADLQEQYQYVLADEHQDANALQHGLLDALAFDDHPNLFIVGDEKQAVFGFQGADLTHFQTFAARYPRTTSIVLTDNYRSYQNILDISHTLLSRLPASGAGHARLAAARGEGGHAHLMVAPDDLAERDQVATLVARAISEGVKPEEIAVITLKNKTADLFAVHLRARGIPVLRAGNVDLEGRPLIRFLLAFMHAIADPNATASLRESLLAPWWQEPLSRRAAFMRQTSDHEFAEALLGEFPDIANLVETLREQASVMPPLSLLSRLLEDSGARDYFLQSADAIRDDVPLVRTLLMHMEDIVRRSPNAVFSEVMDTFTKAREHEIGSVKTTLTQKEGHVTVITAHKAKGMEFERVFVGALTAREWEGRGKSSLVPSPFDSVREHEEVVRLLYVALTRAKDELVLSYGAAGAEGKEQPPISILPEELPSLQVDASPLPHLHDAVNPGELVRELTLSYLLHDGLSPSAMNDYLASPPAFFAKRVLRLREPETRSATIGNAVHAAIAAYYRSDGEADEDRLAKARAELARSMKRSLLPRGDTFEQMMRHAKASVDAYLRSASRDRAPVAIEETFTTAREVAGAPVILKGKLDALFAGDGGECIVDFKTSSSLNGKKEGFERQLAFYDLLLRENGHAPNQALIVLVGEDEVKEHDIALTEETRAELSRTLEEVTSELVSGKWRAPEEPSEYDGLLKLFEA